MEHTQGHGRRLTFSAKARTHGLCSGPGKGPTSQREQGASTPRFGIPESEGFRSRQAEAPDCGWGSWRRRHFQCISSRAMGSRDAEPERRQLAAPRVGSAGGCPPGTRDSSSSPRREASHAAAAAFCPAPSPPTPPRHNLDGVGVS